MNSTSRTWLRRHKGPINFAVSLLIIAVLMALARKLGLLSLDDLASHKDGLSALNSIATMLVLLIGSLLSYYRFFRGRTLSLRAEVSVDVSVHPTGEKRFLHVITVTARNIGSSSIWNSRARLTARIRGPGGTEERAAAATEGDQPLTVIDPGESCSHWFYEEIPDDAWLVTYDAAFVADTGDVWFFSKTVSNEAT